MALFFRALALVPILLLPFSSRADDVKAPPVAAPAFLDVVKFSVRLDGENHQLVVNSGGGLLRVDEPQDGYSVIYNAATENYIGLEHRNYTYWEFSWDTVRADVERSKRAEARLQDLSGEGLNDYADSTNTDIGTLPGASPTPMVPDGPGYIWKPTDQKKKIAGLDCIQWVGETSTGESIQAWCCTGLQTQIEQAVQLVRPMNEPIALVPVRMLVPPVVYGVFDALIKGGVTPVDITWGTDENKNHFTFVNATQRPGKMALFTVPDTYIKTTLVTMDGLIDQKVQPQPTASPPPIGLPSASRVAP